MKKTIALILSILMLCCSLAACGGEKNSMTIEKGKLIMSTNAAFPPYEMTTDDGGFAGIDIEIAQAIADKLGLELVIDDMDFDGALLAVQQSIRMERIKAIVFFIVCNSFLLPCWGSCI